jgi:hypothetical protein
MATPRNTPLPTADLQWDSADEDPLVLRLVHVVLQPDSLRVGSRIRRCSCWNFLLAPYGRPLMGWVEGGRPQGVEQLPYSSYPPDRGLHLHLGDGLRLPHVDGPTVNHVRPRLREGQRVDSEIRGAMLRISVDN